MPRQPSLRVSSTINTVRRRVSAQEPPHEEDRGLHRKPTIKLLPKTQESLPQSFSSSFLNFPYEIASPETYAPSTFPDPENLVVPEPESPVLTQGLSNIPLTPRPDPPSRASTACSWESTETRVSQISRLPTPDFTNTSKSTLQRGAGSLRMLLPKRLSYISFNIPQTPFSSGGRPELNAQSEARHIPPQTPFWAGIRPNLNALRNQSEGSAKTRFTARTTNSVDSGHHALIPSIGTTEKFTHKWPKPHSLKYLDSRTNSTSSNGSSVLLDQAASLALEEGQGLGVGSVMRWTTFKWCLVLSVSTVFVYGAAGLACAIMTWFRSECRFLSSADVKRHREFGTDNIDVFFCSMGQSRCDVRSRWRYSHSHHPRGLHPPLHLPSGHVRDPPQLPPHPSRLHPLVMARLSLPPGSRLHQLPPRHLLSRSQTQPILEPILHPPRPSSDPKLAALLWVLQCAARSHV